MRLTSLLVAGVLAGAAAAPVSAAVVTYQFSGPCSSTCQDYGSEITGSLGLETSGFVKGQPIPKTALQSFAYSLDGVAQPALTATDLAGSLAADGTIHLTLNAFNVTPGNTVSLTASGLDDLIGTVRVFKKFCEDPSCAALYMANFVAAPAPQPVPLPAAFGVMAAGLAALAGVGLASGAGAAVTAARRLAPGTPGSAPERSASARA